MAKRRELTDKQRRLLFATGVLYKTKKGKVALDKKAAEVLNNPRVREAMSKGLSERQYDLTDSQRRVLERAVKRGILDKRRETMLPRANIKFYVNPKSTALSLLHVRND